MPAGLVRSGDFRNGTPIVLPHQFGNSVTSPTTEPFGNNIPQANPRMAGNPVDWSPSPAHFGNQISFLLQTVPPVVIVAPGSTGTTDINLTNLKGTNSAELTYFGEPSGVSLAFATNPDLTSSVVTVTVGADVPSGRYTITIVGTVSSPNIEYVQLNLVVAAASAPPPSGFFRAQVDLDVSQMTAAMSQVVADAPIIIPAPGEGYYNNVIMCIHQYHYAGLPAWRLGTNAQMNLLPLALAENVGLNAEPVPTIYWDSLIDKNDASQIASFFMQEGIEYDDFTYPSAYFNNQPTILVSANAVVETQGTGSVRVIAYYTVEPL